MADSSDSDSFKSLDSSYSSRHDDEMHCSEFHDAGLFLSDADTSSRLIRSRIVDSHKRVSDYTKFIDDGKRIMQSSDRDYVKGANFPHNDSVIDRERRANEMRKETKNKDKKRAQTTSMNLSNDTRYSERGNFVFEDHNDNFIGANAGLRSEVNTLRECLAVAHNRIGMLENQVAEQKGLIKRVKTTEAVNSQLMLKIDSLNAELSNSMAVEANLQAQNADLAKQCMTFKEIVSNTKANEPSLRAKVASLEDELQICKLSLLETQVTNTNQKTQITSLEEELQNERLDKEKALNASQLSNEVRTLKTALSEAQMKNATLIDEANAWKVALSIAFYVEDEPQASEAILAKEADSWKNAMALAISAEERAVSTNAELTIKVNTLTDSLRFSQNRVTELESTLSIREKELSSRWDMWEKNEMRYLHDIAQLQEALASVENAKGSIKGQYSYKEKSLQQAEEKLETAEDQLSRLAEDFYALQATLDATVGFYKTDQQNLKAKYEKEISDLKDSLALIESLNDSRQVQAGSLREYQIHLQETKKKLMVAEEHIGVLQKEIKVLKESPYSTTSRTDDKELIKCLEEHLREANSQNLPLKDEIARLEEYLQASQELNAELRSEASMREDIMKREEAALQKASDKISVLSALQSKNEAEIKTLKKALEEKDYERLSRQCSKLNALVDSLEAGTSELSSNLLAAQNAKENAELKVTELQMRVDGYSTQLKEMQNREIDLKAGLVRASDNSSSTNSQVNELKRVVATVEADKRKLSNSLMQAESERGELEKRLAECTSQLRTLQQRDSSNSTRPDKPYASGSESRVVELEAKLVKMSKSLLSTQNELNAASKIKDARELQLRDLEAEVKSLRQMLSISKPV